MQVWVRVSAVSSIRNQQAEHAGLFACLRPHRPVLAPQATKPATGTG